MPTFNITAPNGQTLKITGDVMPSEAEIDNIFSEMGVVDNQQPTTVLQGGVRKVAEDAPNADILNNPNLTPEQMAEQIQARGEKERRDLDWDLAKYKSKSRLGAGLSFLSATPGLNAATGGGFFGLGHALIEDKPLLDTLKDTALFAVGGKVADWGFKLGGKALGAVGKTKTAQALGKKIADSKVGEFGKKVGKVLTKDIFPKKQSQLVTETVNPTELQEQIVDAYKKNDNVKISQLEEDIENVLPEEAKADFWNETYNKVNDNIPKAVEAPAEAKQLELGLENLKAKEPKTLTETFLEKGKGNDFEDEMAKTIKKIDSGNYTQKDFEDLNSFINELENEAFDIDGGVDIVKELRNKYKNLPLEDLNTYMNRVEQFSDGYNPISNKVEPIRETPQISKQSPKTKERSFVETIKENYGDDVAQQITDKDYEVYSHERQIADWNSRTPEQKLQALNETDNINPDVLYGKAQALNQAIKNGEPINVDMLNGVAKNLTEAGQEIEAAKHFVPTSPEGITLETIKQTRKNLPKNILKLKDETESIVKEVKKATEDMSNEEAAIKFDKWLNTQIDKVKQKPVYGEKLELLKSMENYRVQKANRALQSSENRMAREEFLNTDYSNEEAVERFLHGLSKDKRPPKAKSTRGTKEDLLKGMENYRKKEIQRLAREEKQAISKIKKQELQKQKELEKEELDAIKALQKEEEKRLKNIERILSKRTVKPKEQKNLATKILELQDNNGLTPENFSRLVDKHYNIKSIDVSDYPKIQELSDRFVNAQTDRERDVATGLIKKFIWNKQPKKWAEKDRTFRNMNMLLSIPSRTIDLISTTGFQGLNAVDELVAKGIDKVAGTGLRSGISSLNPQLWAKNVARGAKEGLEDVKLGINTARSGEMDRYELGFYPQFEDVPGLNELEKVLSTTIRVPDRMFYEARFNSALNDLMKTGKFTEEEAIEIAKNEALQAVFQGQGVLSQGSKFVRDLLNGRINNKPILGESVGQDILDNLQFGNRIAPFVQTPANLITEGLERSPLGLTKGAFEMATARTPAELRQAQQTLAKGITGTAAATVGGGLLLNNVPNTIGGFSNEDKFGDEVTGLPPQSIVIGDKAVSLAGVPFLTIPMGLGKALLEPDKTVPERLINASTYTGNILSDLPMLKGLGDFYKGGVDIAKAGADYALGNAELNDVGQTAGRILGQQGANILSQYIPLGGTLGTIRNAVDPYNREMTTYNENPLIGTAKYIGNRLQNRLPIASSYLPMKYNVLGEPSMRSNIENPGLRALEAIVSPVRIRNYNERPSEVDEMQRIQDYAMENDITGKTTLKFEKPKRYIGKGKDKIRLNNEEYSELNKLYNGQLYEELQFLMNTPEYQEQDEETKIKWVREVMKEVKNNAETQLFDIINK